MQQVKDGQRSDRGWMAERSARSRELLQKLQADGLDVKQAGAGIVPDVASAHAAETFGYEAMRRRQRENTGA
jgi:hypothetical protein